MEYVAILECIMYHYMWLIAGALCTCLYDYYYCLSLLMILLRLAQIKQLLKVILKSSTFIKNFTLLYYYFIWVNTTLNTDVNIAFIFAVHCFFFFFL